MGDWSSRKVWSHFKSAHTEEWEARASVTRQILSAFQGETQDYEINRTQRQDKPWDLSLSRLDQWFFQKRELERRCKVLTGVQQGPFFHTPDVLFSSSSFQYWFFFFHSWEDCTASFKPVPFGFCLIPSAENISKNTITGEQCYEHVHSDRLMSSRRVRGLWIHRAWREAWCVYIRHVPIVSVLNHRGSKQIAVTVFHPHPSPWVGLGWEDVKDLAGIQQTTVQGPNLAHHLVL